MPLDDLIDVVSSLQERMEKYGAELKENETRTRMALVDPMLTVLGWNTSDPSLVKAEYSVADGRADYALLGPDGKPVACIEAKRLGAPLQQHRMQMLNYCNAGGIKCAGITDGNQWELYDVFSPRPLEERRRLDITIADRTPCGLRLGTTCLLEAESGHWSADSRKYSYRRSRASAHTSTTTSTATSTGAISRDPGAPLANSIELRPAIQYTPAISHKMS